MSRLLASASKAAAATAARLPGVTPAASSSIVAPSSEPPPEPPLEPAVAQVVALAAVAVVKLEQDRDRLVARGGVSSDVRLASHNEWLEGVCRALKVDPSALPSASHLRPADIGPMTALIPALAHPAILHAVIVASVFPPAAAGPSSAVTPTAEAGDVKYSATARRRIFALARLLEIDTRLIVRAEERVATELYDVLRQGAATEEAAKAKEEVERVRKQREEGWGGSMGRWVATGAGIVIGGVALGLTGGLAAPAILALLPASLGLLTPAAAPALLGSLFGLAGGGLAGRRVRRRWAGVGEFEFVDLRAEGGDDAGKQVEVAYAVRKKNGQSASTMADDDGSGTKLASLDVRAAETDRSPPTTEEESTTPLILPSRPPSLTVVIGLPGLLTQSADEGLSAWRTVGAASRAGEIRRLPLADPTTAHALASEKEGGLPIEAFELPEETDDEGGRRPTIQADLAGDEGALLLRDRDLFVAKIETAQMFSTGKDVNEFITSKILHKATSEVLKRTVLNAYLAAVALPLTVYGWAGTALDNTWMRAVDKARKAGPLLAEILRSRPQGARPVQLVGHSLGALTVFHALLALAAEAEAETGNSTDPPTTTSSRPSSAAEALELVDSAILISLPAAPSAEQWATASRATGRRLVNGWSGRDFVLASVVRLHEVIGNAVELRDGAHIAGLSEVKVAGVENVDLSDVVDGHFAINSRLPDILRLIDLDG